MALNDIQFLDAGELGTNASLPYRVQAGSVIINPGEPVSRVIGANYVNTLYDTSASSTVTSGATKPVVATDYIVGIGMSSSSNTATADGGVDIQPLATDVVYSAAPYLGNAFTFTGNLTSGSSIVSNISSFTGLIVGQLVTGSNIATGSIIASLNSAGSTITLSQNATGNGTAGTFTVNAPVMNFTGTLATGVTTITSLSSIPGGLISGQVITDITSAARITTGTTISTVGSTTVTMSATAVSSGTTDTLRVALLTSNGFNLTQAQYNVLVGSTALIAAYTNPITSLNTFALFPSTTSTSNGCIIQWSDVTKLPGRIAFSMRGALSDNS